MMTLLALFPVLAEAESVHERLLAQPRQLTNLQLNVNCDFILQYPDDCDSNGCANETAAKTELDEFIACATPYIMALNTADFDAWKRNKKVGEEYCNVMKPAVECAPDWCKKPSGPNSMCANFQAQMDVSQLTVDWQHGGPYDCELNSPRCRQIGCEATQLTENMNVQAYCDWAKQYPDSCGGTGHTQTCWTNQPDHLGATGWCDEDDKLVNGECPPSPEATEFLEVNTCAAEALVPLMSLQSEWKANGVLGPEYCKTLKAMMDCLPDWCVNPSSPHSTCWYAQVQMDSSQCTVPESAGGPMAECTFSCKGKTYPTTLDGWVSWALNGGEEESGSVLTAMAAIYLVWS